METPNSDPLAGLQGCLVAESPFLEAIWLVESNRTNPALLARVGAFQDGDPGIPRQKLVHKGKVPLWYTDRLVASASSPPLRPLANPQGLIVITDSFLKAQPSVTIVGMTEVQQLIQELRVKGWSIAAIGRKVGVTDMAVRRWISGDRRPENVVAVTIVLRQMLKRRRIPKRPYRRKSGVA
jgi:hypothetical protein